MDPSFSQEATIFELLVRYHIERNLPKQLEYMRDGRILDDRGRPFIQGRENKWSQGVLLIADGATLASRLMEDHVILDEEDPEFEQLSDPAGFSDYLTTNRWRDGAYILNADGGKIAHVSQFNNNPGSERRKPLRELLPVDFVQSAATYLDRRLVGTRTRVAAVLPQMYPVEAFQIKQSAYGELGIGVVTRFTKDGLAESFHFQYDAVQGPYVHADHPIVGVHRIYGLVNTHHAKLDERRLELPIPAALTLPDRAA